MRSIDIAEEYQHPRDCDVDERGKKRQREGAHSHEMASASAKNQIRLFVTRRTSWIERELLLLLLCDEQESII